MPDLSRKTASIYINQAPAEEALKKLQTQADKLTASISKGQDAGKKMVSEIAKLSTTKDQIAAVQKQIDSGLKPSFNQLQTLVAKTRAELKGMSESDPGFLQKAKDLNKYSTEMQRLGTQIGAVKQQSGGFKDMLADALPALGWAAAGAAVIGFFKDAFTEALKADEALGKFQGTLDNLGKADAFDRLSVKAEDMAKRFKFIDTPDVVGVFDKLITYGKLTESQIDNLMPVIINFAAKSRISMDEASSTIIKALEGNGKALKTYGINIKDAKTESERLGIIMNDLGGKVRGAADAFGGTTAGKIAETEQSIKNLKAEIGVGLLPVIKSLLSEFNEMIKMFSGFKELFTDKLSNVITRVKDGFMALVTGGPEALRKLNDIRNNVVDTGKQINDIANGIGDAMGTKSIAEQKKLADAYKNVFINARKELADFQSSGDAADKDKLDKLKLQVEQKGKIFLSTQRTLNDSLEQDRRQADDKAKADAEDAEKKRQAALKKAQEEYQQLLKVWQDLRDRINDPYAFVNDDPVLSGFKRANDQAKKDTAEIKLLYDKRVIDHQMYSDAIVRIEAIRQKQLQDILAKNRTNQSDITVDPNNLSLVKPLDTTKAIATKNANDNKDFQLSREKVLQDNLAKYQLDAIKSTGKKKLDADLAVLDLQEAQELAKKDHTENQKLLIEAQYQEKRAEAEKNHILATAQTVLDIAQSAANLFETIDSQRQVDDQAKLDQNQKNYDDDKNKLDRNLQAKVVSQKEYDRQLNALDEKKRKADAVVKKKDFEASKRQQEIQAIMSGAQAVVSTLAAIPGPLDIASLGAARIIQLALIAATTTAQIAVISKQKAPEYAKGGTLLNGPSHANGGMSVVNQRGKKVAEVEGGEPILSKKTYANNKNLVDQLLQASMYGNGARITPYWQNRSYHPVNYSGINRSISTVRYFERGGMMPGNNISNTTDQNSNDFTSLHITSLETNTASNLALIDAINDLKANPLKAYMLLSEVNAQQDVMNRIISETTMKR